MKIGVLSDIHSNPFALDAVVADMDSASLHLVIVLGDIFGYYPWAAETFAKVVRRDWIVIGGNHDALVLLDEPPQPVPPYWDAIRQNRRALNREALEWIRNLPSSRTIEVSDVRIDAYHGTPDEPLTGRYYPTDQQLYSWLPEAGRVLLLGHTHYPLFKVHLTGGVVANPGSVGQPRDGDIRASWGLLDTESFSFDIRRVNYDTQVVVETLVEMGWHKHAVRALQKKYRGPLRAMLEAGPQAESNDLGARR